MVTEDLPPRDEVALLLSEEESFARASETYERWVTSNTSSGNREILAEIETLVFRPATELQLAGLNLLSGQDFVQPKTLSVSLACFAVDHLLWGWFAGTIGHPRVALTLSRAAVEASIFEVASVHSPREFRNMWESRRGTTGGAMLRQLTGIPKDLTHDLTAAWALTVSFGHASPIPVTSAATRFHEKNGIGIGVTYAGQFAGPLDAEVLRNLGNAYSLASVAGARAMKFSLSESFVAKERWMREYAKLEDNLNRRVPIPPHLEPHIGEFKSWKRKHGIAD